MSGRKKRYPRLMGCTDKGRHRPEIVRIDEHYVGSAGLVAGGVPILSAESAADMLAQVMAAPVTTKRAHGLLVAWECPACGTSYRLRTTTLYTLGHLAQGKRINWFDLSTTETALAFWRNLCDERNKLRSATP